AGHLAGDSGGDCNRLDPVANSATCVAVLPQEKSFDGPAAYPPLSHWTRYAFALHFHTLHFRLSDRRLHRLSPVLSPRFVGVARDRCLLAGYANHEKRLRASYQPPHGRGRMGERSVISLARRVLEVLAFIIIGLIALSSLGVNVTAALAGL